MAGQVRAKFRCVRIEHNAFAPQQIKYTFTPQYDTSVPEDQRYSTLTPVGELWMLVDNPAVSFELGGYYYLDFTAV